MEIDRRIAELYAQPLDEFTGARDKLAAELKAANDDRAAEVKKLRKPGVPVWAGNRLAAEHPTEFAELVMIGERLREAHADLLAGGDPEIVRTRAAEEREIVARLVGYAKEILEAAGHKPSPATLERIGATLLGLATDPEAAEAAKAGILDREVTRGGFDDSVAFETMVPADDVRNRRTEAAAKSSAARRARESADKARRRADELARRASEITREAEELAAETEKVAVRAADAHRAADEANEEANAAETEAGRLEAGAD
jgi:hypothetical protein